MSARNAKRSAKKAAQLSHQIGERIEAQRRLLFGASAIVMCCRYALDSRLEGPDEIIVGDALQVAGNIIGDVAEVLEAFGCSGELYRDQEIES